VAQGGWLLLFYTLHWSNASAPPALGVRVVRPGSAAGGAPRLHFPLLAGAMVPEGGHTPWAGAVALPLSHHAQVGKHGGRELGRLEASCCRRGERCRFLQVSFAVSWWPGLPTEATLLVATNPNGRERSWDSGEQVYPRGHLAAAFHSALDPSDSAPLPIYHITYHFSKDC
jgi:hypothetical protein